MFKGIKIYILDFWPQKFLNSALFGIDYQSLGCKDTTFF